MAHKTITFFQHIIVESLFFYICRGRVGFKLFWGAQCLYEDQKKDKIVKKNSKELIHITTFWFNCNLIQYLLHKVLNKLLKYLIYDI